MARDEDAFADDRRDDRRDDDFAVVFFVLREGARRFPRVRVAGIPAR